MRAISSGAPIRIQRDFFQEVVQALGITPGGAIDRRLDRPGANRQYAHSVRGRFLSQSLGQHANGRLIAV